MQTRKLDRETAAMLEHMGIDQATLPPMKQKKKDLAGPLTKAILKYLHAQGCMAWRENSGMARAMHGKGYVHLAPKGTPDIVGMTREGRFLGIEVKTTDRTSPEQEYWHKCAKERGAICGVAKSVDDVAILLADAKLHA